MVLFEDGAYPAEVTQFNGDHHEVEVFAKAWNGKRNGVSLWKHPSQDQKENHWIHKNSVLPVRPVFGVDKYSTHLMILYELLNSDVIDKFD